ncbi:unnamed protein product [Amaranthus hypochondriacus]
MDTESVDELHVSVTDNDPGCSNEAASTDIGTLEYVASEKDLIQEVGVEVTLSEKGTPEDVSSEKELTRDVGIETTSADNGTSEDITSEKVGVREVGIEAISPEKGVSEVVREVGSALIRLELDIACCSEKLVNMNLLMMHVAARESDFEVFASEQSDSLMDSDEKAMEFDILSGIFDLEVREMSGLIHRLEIEIDNISKVISSHRHLGAIVLALEEKLRDAEESVKQSHEQITELLMQSTKFQKILSSVNQEETSEDEKESIFCIDFFSTTTKLKVQTSEQQRHLLKMLEKSLERELELENELKECKQSLNEIKNASQMKISSAEEATAAAFAYFLEADSASAVLLGISKELIGKLQLYQLQINSSLHRENEMFNKLKKCAHAVQELEKKEAAMQKTAVQNSLEASTLKAKVSALEEQLKASESIINGNALGDTSEQHDIEELEKRIFIAESRAQKAEDDVKSLTEANKKLVEEMNFMKNMSIEKVSSLEKQLKETDIQLQEAIASVEASEEKQKMLYSSISDMEILIEKFKSKVLEAKSKVLEANDRADSAEDKCIILSESHAALSEELTFLRGKLENLEASLQLAEETKQAAAVDITMRTKVITDMVVQLAVERERLHKQISMLMMENRVLVDKLHTTNIVSSNSTNHKDRETEKGVLSSDCPDDVGKGNKDDFEATKVEKSRDDILDGECNSEPQDLDSNFETVRTIDARQLNVKYVFFACLIVLIAVLVVCFVQPENHPF